MDVTLDQLRTLAAVASAGSFSAAARKLGRVQAAVSQSIDRLEAQLGLRLFDRSGRVPRLTEHGQAIALAAARVESGVVSLTDLAQGLKQGKERSLAIVVDAMFPTESLADFAKDFAREHPDVDLVLFTEVLSAVTAHVRSKRATWGVAVEDADFRDLDSRAIADVRLVSVVAADHPLVQVARAREPLGTADLANVVQIVLSEQRVRTRAREGRDDERYWSESGVADGVQSRPRAFDPPERASEDQGVLSPRTWRVVDLATKHALIARGLGWGNLPEHVVREDLQAGRLVKLNIEAWTGGALRRSLVLCWRKNATMGPVARWAQTRIAQLCREAVTPAPMALPSSSPKKKRRT